MQCSQLKVLFGSYYRLCCLDSFRLPLHTPAVLRIRFRHLVGDWDFSFSGRHDTVDYKQKRDGEANSCPGVRLRGLSCREGLHLLATISTSPPSWGRTVIRNGRSNSKSSADGRTEPRLTHLTSFAAAAVCGSAAAPTLAIAAVSSTWRSRTASSR
jgi:hypothetical protein